MRGMGVHQSLEVLSMMTMEGGFRHMPWTFGEMASACERPTQTVTVVCEFMPPLVDIHRKLLAHFGRKQMIKRANKNRISLKNGTTVYLDKLDNPEVFRGVKFNSTWVI